MRNGEKREKADVNNRCLHRLNISYYLPVVFDVAKNLNENEDIF